MRKKILDAVHSYLPLLERAMDIASPDTDKTIACYAYAVQGAEALRMMGYPTARAVAGRAMWRVGPGDGDVVHHVPEFRMPMYGGNFAYHCWIMVDDWIVDATTQHLKAKLAALDAIDGRQSQCIWPKELVPFVAHRSQVADMKRCRDGYHIDAFYEEVPGMIDAMMNGTYEESPWSGTATLEQR